MKLKRTPLRDDFRVARYLGAWTERSPWLIVDRYLGRGWPCNQVLRPLTESVKLFSNHGFAHDVDTIASAILGSDRL